MKIFFEWFSFIFSSLGIIYSIYMLYVEIIKNRINNKDRFFLLLFIIFALIGIVEKKINFLF